MDKELFKGYTVLSLEQALALPYCTFRLAMGGMEVIRVEPPIGDPNRYIGTQLPGEDKMGSYFLTINSCKKSITLNLKNGDGKKLLYDLIRKLPVDIFCTNTLPSKYESIGIDYKTLSSINPELIWVGLSGFGPSRPEAAYDPIMQAMLGMMDLTGEEMGDPMQFGAPIVDLGAANQAYAAIMEALYKLEKYGKGSRIDVSMAESSMAFLATKLPLYSMGEVVKRSGNRHRFFAPVNTMKTKDGFILIAVGNERQWQELVKFPGFESLARVEFDKNSSRIKNSEKLYSELNNITKNLECKILIDLCNGANIPASKVNTFADILEDEFLSTLTLKTKDPVTGKEAILAPMPAGAAKLSDKITFPPRLGEHNQEIYGDRMNLDISRLSIDKVI
ncbi:CoA transferase [bacterium]|nr:CoA transferase [bacterium]